MLRKAYLLLTMGLILGILPGASAAQNTSSPPFVYYYSLERSAFVIERADGSDSQVLTDFVMPQSPVGGNWIVGPGWSVSGNWFAWTILTFAGAGGGKPSASVGFIASRDGKTLLSLIKNPEGITRFDLKWSPTQDLLLVNEVYFPPNDNEQNITGRTYIFDPNTQQEVQEIEHYNYLTDWTPDGRFIVNYAVTYNPFNAEMILLTGDDTVQTRSIEELNVVWNNEGKAIYKSDPETLVVEDFAEGSGLTFPSPSGVITAIDWSPDNRYAFILFKDKPDDMFSFEFGRLALFSVATQTLEIISNAASIPGFTDFRLWYTYTSWSPDSKYGAFLSSNNHIFLIAPHMATPEAIPLPSNLQVKTFNWASNTQLIVYGMKGETGVLYRYDVSTGMPEDFSNAESISPYHFSASADGHYIALDGPAPDLSASHERAFTMIDTLSGQITYHGIASNEAFGVYETQWHPTQNWLFLLSLSFADGVRFITLSNEDGTIQRELGACFSPATSCYGWMPD